MPNNTMRAIRIHEFGGPNVLQDEEVPRPTPGAGEVLVRVRAVGVNPYDWKFRKGMYPSDVTFPMIPGSELAGTVEMLGAGVNGLRAGQDVFASGIAGAYAEYVVATPTTLADKPVSLDFIQAATVPVG